MRRSSRGNPYHDERGRFTTANHCSIKSERSSEEYEQQTKERQSKQLNLKDMSGHPFNAVIVKRKPKCRDIGQYKVNGKEYLIYRINNEYYAVERKYPKGEFFVVDGEGYTLTRKGKLCEGMLVEYTPDWCAEGESDYVFVVKELYTYDNGRQGALIGIINGSTALGHMEMVDAAMIQPASKQKVELADVDFPL